MHVLYTIASLDLNSGGTATAVTALANAVVSDRCDLTLYTLKHKNQDIIPFDRNPSLNLDLFDGDYYSLFPIYSRDILFQNIKSIINNFSLLHSHGIWLPINHYSSVLASKEVIPLIISPHGMLEPWALQFKKYKKKIAWFLYQQKDLCRAIVLHATSMQEAVNFRHLGFTQSIAVIPNGVSVPDQMHATREVNRTRKVLFLSRIHPKKGLLDLVEAWAKLRPLGWKVMIAGPDDSGHQTEVVARVASLGLKGAFEFIGPVYGLAKWELFANCDVFVLPSYSENFGIVIAEALASGVPVITTRATPWQELQTHNCGWWVDVGVQSLWAALREATSLPDAQRQTMGKRGRQLVQDAYSWPKIGVDMANVYEWVLGGGSPPACVMTD